MKINEIKCGAYHKTTLLKTNDLTESGFLQAYKKATMTDYNEYYDEDCDGETPYQAAMRQRWITIHDDGFVVWSDVDKRGCDYCSNR